MRPAGMQHPSVAYKGEANPVGLLKIVWLLLHATGTRNLVQGGVEVDIRVLLLKMLLVQVGATPFECIAMITRPGVVCLSAMSPNALSLCVGFVANIAQVWAITSPTCASWSSRRP